MTDLHTRIAELAAKAEQTDDDIRYYSGGSKYNEPREELGQFIQSNLPEILTALRIAEKVMDEDWLEEVISDSLDMDWHPRDAARAIIAALKEPT